MVSFLFRKSSKIKIIRVANEGFNTKPYNQGPTSVFLDVLITDLDAKIRATHEQASHNKNNKMDGCFCFLEKFDKSQLEDSGSLFYRKGHKWNIGFLPIDEIVFVRNTKNNKIPDRFVTHIETEKMDSYTNQPIFETLGGKPYEFIKMPLSLALKRLEEHMKLQNNEKADEEIAELYLTEKQIKEKFSIKKWYNFLK
jgi:hypothetical protein